MTRAGFGVCAPPPACRERYMYMYMSMYMYMCMYMYMYMYVARTAIDTPRRVPDPGFHCGSLFTPYIPVNELTN